VPPGRQSGSGHGTVSQPAPLDWGPWIGEKGDGRTRPFIEPAVPGPSLFSKEHATSWNDRSYRTGPRAVSGSQVGRGRRKSRQVSGNPAQERPLPAPAGHMQITPSQAHLTPCSKGQPVAGYVIFRQRPLNAAQRPAVPSAHAPWPPSLFICTLLHLSRPAEVTPAGPAN
jgi:hypothetical protein